MEHNISHDTNDSVLLKPDGTVPALPHDEWYTWGFTKGEPRIVDAAGLTVCLFEKNSGETDAEMQARAEFIVRAGNSHDPLVDALEGCVEALDLTDDEMPDLMRAIEDKVRAALADAKGEPR